MGFATLRLNMTLLLVYALQSPASDSSPFGGIVLDCKNLALGFISCKFSFVFRSVNQVAHRLARVASSMPSPGHWVCTTLVFLTDVLASDI